MEMGSYRALLVSSLSSPFSLRYLCRYGDFIDWNDLTKSFASLLLLLSTSMLRCDVIHGHIADRYTDTAQTGLHPCYARCTVNSVLLTKKI